MKKMEDLTKQELHELLYKQLYVVFNLWHDGDYWCFRTCLPGAYNKTEARNKATKYFRKIGQPMKYGCVIGPIDLGMLPWSFREYDIEQDSRLDGYVYNEWLNFILQEDQENWGPYDILDYFKKYWFLCLGL
ncbi:hypothetical protein [Candidatus Xianfuyuplasma coldseepsis]|uniref:Uncharacterized protein n=1 Tax=Candidatus Xianfuyuplasma coldseepsis TaxID=2782163 RepID=A0A7L7KSM7_9MOLU|nr:hypothetical protein [Xianfuyuplasma coldseepsis]QMS85272.1 hypothetical protein G4Z02_05750 [Xianfuyuplasma coldseepsis]